MNIYTNAFRCASNEAGTEFTLQCLQTYPVYNDKNEIERVENEIVASLVMSGESARSLAALISESPVMNE